MLKTIFGLIFISILLFTFGCSKKEIVIPSFKSVISPSPSELYFEATAGGVNPPKQRIYINNSGGETLDVRATTDANWINLATTHGTDPDTIVVTISTALANAGVSVDSIRLTDILAENSPVFIKVTFDVSKTIRVSPNKLTYSWVIGAPDLEPQSIIIEDPGNSNLEYTVTNNADWITLSKTSGTAPDTISVTVDPTGSGTGLHIDTLIVSSPEAENDTNLVEVVLAVSSWELSNTGINPIHTLDGLKFLTDDIIWTVGSILSGAEDIGVAFRSIDAGQTWDRLEYWNGTKFGGITFVNDTIALIAGDSAMILRSVDAGLNWTEIENIPINPGSTFRSIISVSEDTAYVAGHFGAIARSTDRGLTWTAQWNPAGDIFSLGDIDATDGTTVWIVGNHGTILRTLNAGEVWTEQASPVNNDLLGIDFIDFNNGWIVGSHGTVLKTNNAGDSWEQVEIGISVSLFDVYFYTSELGWIVGDSGKIMFTENGGDTWIRQYLPNPDTNFPKLDEIEFLAADTGLIIGAEGIVYRTTSGGF